ncbi:MAG: type II secretion system protein GspM [Porticoccaceae bacterium]
MDQLVTKITAWWQSLSDSDRRILQLSSPVILILFLYLVLVQPILGHYLDVKKQHREMQESLVWLYENSALVNRMQNQCLRERPQARGNSSLSGFVQDIGRRAGAETSVRVINNRELDISINAVAGTRALELVQSYVCAGFEIAGLRVARETPEAAQVELSARLSATDAIVSPATGAGQ